MHALLSAGDIRIGQHFGNLIGAENSDRHRPHIMCLTCGALRQVSADALAQGEVACAQCDRPIIHRHAPPIARATLRLRP